MSDMAESILDNPIVSIVIVVAVLAFVFSMIFKKKMPRFKEFKPVQFKDTVYDDLMEKVKNQGLKLKKGKLIIGVNKIADIHKWIRVQGHFTSYFYDQKSKELKVDDKAEEVKYDMMVFLCKSKNIIFRIFGFKKYFFLLKKESFLKFDELSNSFILEEGTDLVSYGNIWINSQDSIEYLHDISIKKMNIELMCALENYPNKIVHLEMAQAKKERLYREMVETDKSRYEATKKGEDTVIS